MIDDRSDGAIHLNIEQCLDRVKLTVQFMYISPTNRNDLFNLPTAILLLIQFTEI